MKLLIKRTDLQKIYEIADKMVDTAHSMTIQRDRVDKEVLERVTSFVKDNVRDTLGLLMDGADSVLLEYDLEEGIVNTYESICHLVKTTIANENVLKDEVEGDVT